MTLPEVALLVCAARLGKRAYDRDRARKRPPARTAAYMREFRAKKGQKYLDQIKAYRAKNPHVVKNANKRWREKNRGKAYGVTPEYVEGLFVAQNGECGVCQNPLKEGDTNIDHDHTSLKVRGLLCRKCNLGLGYFKDSEDLLELAAAYLRKHKV